MALSPRPRQLRATVKRRSVPPPRLELLEDRLVLSGGHLMSAPDQPEIDHQAEDQRSLVEAQADPQAVEQSTANAAGGPSSNAAALPAAIAGLLALVREPTPGQGGGAPPGYFSSGKGYPLLPVALEPFFSGGENASLKDAILAAIDGRGAFAVVPVQVPPPAEAAPPAPAGLDPGAFTPALAADSPTAATPTPLVVSPAAPASPSPTAPTLAGTTAAALAPPPAPATVLPATPQPALPAFTGYPLAPTPVATPVLPMAPPTASPPPVPIPAASGSQAELLPPTLATAPAFPRALTEEPVATPPLPLPAPTTPTLPSPPAATPRLAPQDTPASPSPRFGTLPLFALQPTSAPADAARMPPTAPPGPLVTPPALLTVPPPALPRLPTTGGAAAERAAPAEVRGDTTSSSEGATPAVLPATPDGEKLASLDSPPPAQAAPAEPGGTLEPGVAALADAPSEPDARRPAAETGTAPWSWRWGTAAMLSALLALVLRIGRDHVREEESRPSVEPPT